MLSFFLSTASFLIITSRKASAAKAIETYYAILVNLIYIDVTSVYVTRLVIISIKFFIACLYILLFVSFFTITELVIWYRSVLK